MVVPSVVSQLNFQKYGDVVRAALHWELAWKMFYIKLHFIVPIGRPLFKLNFSFSLFL